MVELSRQLKRALELRKVSSAELSRRTGVPKQTLCDWLSGSSPRNIQQVKRVSDELGIAFMHLLFGEDEAPKLPRSHNHPETLVRMYVDTTKPCARRETKKACIEGRSRMIKQGAEFFFRRSSDLLRVRDLKHVTMEFSPSWSKKLGWNIDELRNQHPLHLFPPEERRKLVMSVAKHIRSGTADWKVKHKVLHRDGHYVKVETLCHIDPGSELLMTASRIVGSSD